MDMSMIIELLSTAFLFVVTFLAGANVLTLGLRLMRYHRLAERLQWRMINVVSLFRLGVR